ncbi:hypothetical protein QTG54_008944 [Skeletonema marinoi]|uniref:Uncharacterized protein n=1 Tax=Skeletonema marinoi TaxID=267567 RepID=A0AAD9DBL1_9STRA|nr:hypothetical protein QTG54_008944 [Skeletonema marinoi]
MQRKARKETKQKHICKSWTLQKKLGRISRDKHCIIRVRVRVRVRGADEGTPSKPNPERQSSVPSSFINDEIME